MRVGSLLLVGVAGCILCTETAGQTLGERLKDAAAADGGVELCLGCFTPADALRVEFTSDNLGRLQRGWLGILVGDATPDFANRFAVPAPYRASVSKIFPGSPAEKAGLHVDDVILAIGQDTTNVAKDVVRVVAGSPTGEPATLHVWRDRKEQTLPITIGQWPETAQLHIWRPSGPSGEGHRHLYWSDPGNDNTRVFGTWRCDDQGYRVESSIACQLRGEKFIVPESVHTVKVTTPNLLYCFAVQLWKQPESSPPKLDAYFHHESGAILHCSSNEPKPANELAQEFDPFQGEFAPCHNAKQDLHVQLPGVPDDGAWTGIVALELPARGVSLTQAGIRHSKGLQCDLDGKPMQ